MPELPEVETTVRDISKFVIGDKIVDFWTDTPARTHVFINKEKSFNSVVTGRKIREIERKGKNIIINLSERFSLLIHQKIAGHLLFGKWSFTGKKWLSDDKLLSEKINSYIRFVFILESGNMIAMSDPRKFAKVEIWDEDNLKDKLKKDIGPDPLKINLNQFKKEILNKKSIIKKVLMDQSVISGIGNIYSDEILWDARISPYRRTGNINEAEMKVLFSSTKKILSRAIKLKGDSMSDYRLIDGSKGKYQNEHKVYGKEGYLCPRKDEGTIERNKLGGRSLRFCPVCQE